MRPMAESRRDLVEQVRDERPQLAPVAQELLERPRQTAVAIGEVLAQDRSSAAPARSLDASAWRTRPSNSRRTTSTSSDTPASWRAVRPMRKARSNRAARSSSGRSADERGEVGVHDRRGARRSSGHRRPGWRWARSGEGSGTSRTGSMPLTDRLRVCQLALSLRAHCAGMAIVGPDSRSGRRATRSGGAAMRSGGSVMRSPRRRPGGPDTARRQRPRWRPGSRTGGRRRDGA